MKLAQINGRYKNFQYEVSILFQKCRSVGINELKPKQIIKYITYRKLQNIGTLEYYNNLHKLTIVDYDNTDTTTKYIQEHFTTILDKRSF